MAVVLALGLLPALFAAQTGFSHSPTAADTVRYGRDDFGVRVHTPTAWRGHPVLLYADDRGAIRTVELRQVDATTFRGRFRPGPELQYAFWLDSAKYRKGLAGLVLDKTGTRETATPEWFTQSASDYAEVKPPSWPHEGALLYGLDTDRFGDGSAGERGAQSFTKHRDYVKSLGVTGVWLDAVHADSHDTVEDAQDINWHVVAESTSPLKDADGIAAAEPPPAKGWRIAECDDDAHALIATGGGNGVLDRRWSAYIYGFIRDEDVAPSTLASELEALRGDYPDVVADDMVLRLGGPGRPRPSAVLHSDPMKLQQTWMLLLTLPGVPVIDAGDEIGLLETDGPMQWNPDQQNSTIQTFVRTVAALRSSRPSLYRGDFEVLRLDDDSHVFAFARVDRREVSIVLINNSQVSQDLRVPIGQFGSVDLRDLLASNTFNSDGLNLTISIAAHGFILLGN